MKNKLTLLLLLIFAFAVACTPDAVPTPRPVDDDDGNRPRTQEVEPTAVPPTAAPTPEPDAEQEPLQTISAANFPTLASVPSRPLVLMDQVGGAAKAVALADDVAFAGEGLRVTAVSLTDPTNLAVLGRSEPLGGVVQRLALYQDAAFVVAEPGWIDVLDVSNPAQMRRIAQLPIRGEMQDMVVAG
ncbi:MAG: hypothetical protein KC445_03865, partial [Anaerolineales bacterium]|nr:hypothetical protein [Anaerolineales bacterium]